MENIKKLFLMYSLGISLYSMENFMDRNNDFKDISNVLDLINKDNLVNLNNLKFFISNLYEAKTLKEKESKNLFLNLKKCDVDKLSKLDDFVKELNLNDFLDDNNELTLELINNEKIDFKIIEDLIYILDILRNAKFFKKNKKKEIFFTLLKDGEINDKIYTLLDPITIVEKTNFLNQDEKEKLFFILFNNKEIDDDKSEHLIQDIIKILKNINFLNKEKKVQLFFKLFNEEVFTNNIIDDETFCFSKEKYLYIIIDILNTINFLTDIEKEESFFKSFNIKENNGKFDFNRLKFLESIINILNKYNLKVKINYKKFININNNDRLNNNDKKNIFLDLLKNKNFVLTKTKIFAINIFIKNLQNIAIDEAKGIIYKMNNFKSMFISIFKQINKLKTQYNEEDIKTLLIKIDKSFREPIKKINNNYKIEKKENTLQNIYDYVFYNMSDEKLNEFYTISEDKSAKELDHERLVAYSLTLK